MSVLQAGELTVKRRGGNESYHYVHGIYRGFNRQRLESRGRLEDEETHKEDHHSYHVLSMTMQKVLETVIH